MKGKHKGNNKHVQRGGDEPLLIKDSAIDNKQMPLPIKRIPYDVKIFSFLCIMGILIRVIFAQASKDYATATVYGYGFSILALFGLLISSFAISYKEQLSQGVWGFFKLIFKNALPLILNISIIALILFQNISFYSQINSGKVADEYYQFSGVSSFLILIQSILVINYLMDILSGAQSKNNSQKGGIMAALASELNSIILILSVINIGIIGVLHVILKYFSTDG
jgi:AAA+ ATPase superfamily predicted ATPase